ncbi:hypothetical protein HHI36_004344, partial [Cryptolaemus montrouzieri]
MSVTKLNNENYQLLKHQMRLLLKAKKVCFTNENVKTEVTQTNAREVEIFGEKSAR